jgi:hypothetical protein
MGVLIFISNALAVHATDSLPPAAYASTVAVVPKWANFAVF